MRELEIAESIARDIAVEKRARLDTLIDEIAGANFFDNEFEVYPHLTMETA